MMARSGRFQQVALFFLITLIVGQGNAAIELRGFLTVGANKSDTPSANAEGIINEISYYRDTRAGLNASTVIGKNWSAMLQVMAEGDGPGHNNQFSLDLDWALAKWQINSEFALRVGKQKMPAWIISSYVDIGLLYPWVRPPAEVYRLNPVNNFLGASFEANYPVFGDYRINIELFGGSASANVKQTINSPTTGEIMGSTLEGDADGISGINVTLSNEKLMVRAAYQQSIVKAQLRTPTTSTTLGITTETDVIVDYNLGFTQFFSAGVKYDHNSLLVLSEVVYEETSSSLFHFTTAWYATLGYYFMDRTLLPHLTYSKVEDVQATLDTGTQYSVIAGLNYFFTPEVVGKMEYQQTKVETSTGRYSSDPGRPVNIVSLAVSTTF